MAGKAKKPKAGAPTWMVTFADMMALLLCLFVLLLSFSEMDAAKFKLIAGEMEQAFGLSLKSKLTGMIEFDGSPERRAFKDVRIQKPQDFIPLILPPSVEQADETSAAEAKLSAEEQLAAQEQAVFDDARSQLEEAMASNKDLEAMSDHVRIDMIKDGMRIQIVDQEGGSMFVGGTSKLNVRSLEIMAQVVGIIKNLPNDISIAGHTDASQSEADEGYSNWELSADRANASRRVLRKLGIPGHRIARVVGKADQEPLISEDPFSAQNRRISIILLRQAPVLPPSLQRN